MLLGRLQAILNRNVAGSRRAQDLCRQLDGKVLSLAVEGTPVTLFMRARDGGVELSATQPGTPDASLSGTPLSLLALAGSRAEDSARRGGLRIEGDAETAQGFRDLLRHTQPDFEEELSGVIGDVAAHRVAGTVRALLGFGRRTVDSLATNTAEYLQEEGRDLPARVEVDAWLEAVDRIREDADRLETRLARLESRRRAAPREP